MFLHTYHAPISCLDPIFEFAKKNSQISFFMHISLREVFLHDAEQVFIMVYEVLNDISRIRQKNQSVLI